MLPGTVPLVNVAEKTKGATRSSDCPGQLWTAYESTAAFLRVEAGMGGQRWSQCHMKSS